MSKKKKIYDVLNADTGEVEGSIIATDDEIDEISKDRHKLDLRMAYTKAEMEVVRRILATKLDLNTLLKKPESMD